MKVLLLHPEDAFPLDLLQAASLGFDCGSRPRTISSTYDTLAVGDKLARNVFSLLWLCCERSTISASLRATSATGNMDANGRPLGNRLVGSYYRLNFVAGDAPATHRSFAGSRKNWVRVASCTRVGRILLATALQRRLGVRLTILENRFQSVVRHAHHYRDTLLHLDMAQLAQVLEDKFDGNHSIRRCFTRRGHTSEEPVILLPSAYINVSRAALAYAKLHPGPAIFISPHQEQRQASIDGECPLGAADAILRS